jgi:nucleotide-binding universal stress UspA family protein
MFRKLLLPVDLTDRHQRALDLAAEMAGPDGEVVLLHVIEAIPGLSADEEKPFYARLEKKARSHLERLGGILSSRQVHSRGEVRIGKRVAEIARFAAEAGTDLVVLTAPTFNPEEPAAGWSSLSYRAGFFCPCPVLLVK